MNKQGQVDLNMGLLISVAIAIIVGAILMTSVAVYVGQTTTTVVYNDTADQETTTIPAAGTTIDLAGQDLIDTPIVINSSGDDYDSGNYTIDEGVSATTGVKSIQFTSSADAEAAGGTINISYTAGGEGYIADAGGRAMASLILIFMALVIGVVALVPVMRNKVLDMAGI